MSFSNKGSNIGVRQVPTQAKKLAASSSAKALAESAEGHHVTHAHPMYSKVGESSRRTVLIGSANKNPAGGDTFDQQEYGFAQNDVPVVK
jgi:hypothetical protein